MSRFLAILLLPLFSFSGFSRGAAAPVVRVNAEVTARDQRIRSAIANEPGVVIVRHENGNIRRFTPESATETARGLALGAAFSLGTGLRNSVVMLGPGTFTITKPLRGYSGTKVFGSGRNATIIKMAASSTSSDYFVFRCVEQEDPRSGYRYANNCEARDLTVDVNRQNQLTGQFFGVGVQLMSSNATISHVNCQNAGGNTYDEIFCLSIVGSGGLNGTFKTGQLRNATIENCEVVSVAPGFNSVPIAITPIAINGSWTPDPINPGEGWVVGGKIVDCAVHGIEAGAGLLSFQVSAASGIIVQNCATYDNHCKFVNGFYTDTGSLDRLRVARNRFADVDVGIRVICDGASYHRDTVIFANDVTFRMDAPEAGKAGVEYSGRSRTSGVRVLNNRLTLPPALAVAGVVGVDCDQIVEGFVSNNIIDGFPIPVRLRSSPRSLVSGNTDAAAVPIGNSVP